MFGRRAKVYRRRLLRRVGRVAETRHRALSWAIALGLNAALLSLLLSINFAPPPRGERDAPRTVSVYLAPPPVEDVTERPEEATGARIEGAPDATDAAEDAQPVPPVPDIRPETADAPAADSVSAGQLPEVALPRAEAGRGTPDGLVALNCYEQFADPDKAAECAGREVRSGWRGEVELGEGWEAAAERLRRGGRRVPLVGPDPLAGLGENESYYRNDEGRFVPTPEFRLGRYNEAFDTPEELNRFRRMRDYRTYIGINQDAFADHGTPPSEPLSGWRPSWQLRDDPDIEASDLEELTAE